MAKKSEDEVSARRLMILEQIYMHREGISHSDLKELIPDKYKVTESTIKKDVEDLRNKVPIVEIKGGKVYAAPTGLEAIWAGTPIGPRLVPSESKRKLAKKVFSFVEERRDQIGKLVLGGGTTLYRCACELIKGASSLRNVRIHTANLLIFHEFVCQKPGNLWIETPSGEINFSTASLWRKDIDEYFRDIEADAVITSFSDMSFEKGFCTIHHDINEKRANLKPNPETCKWVIIPIEWRKIARSANTQIAHSRDEQLDFVGGKRKYIIITDRPSDSTWNAEIDDIKLADLHKWEKEYPTGVEIIFA
jgi:DeoR/GlpR family transcriptional regulator of sugar metabolism